MVGSKSIDHSINSDSQLPFYVERHTAICRMVGYEASTKFCIDMGDLLKYHYQGFNLDHFEAHMPEPPQN